MLSVCERLRYAVERCGDTKVRIIPIPSQFQPNEKELQVLNNQMNETIARNIAIKNRSESSAAKMFTR